MPLRTTPLLVPCPASFYPTSIQTSGVRCSIRHQKYRSTLVWEEWMLVWPGFLYKHRYERNNGNTAGHVQLLSRHIRPLPRETLSFFASTSDISLSEISLWFNHNKFANPKDIWQKDRHFSTYNRIQTVKSKRFFLKACGLARDKSYNRGRYFYSVTEI